MAAELFNLSFQGLYGVARKGVKPCCARLAGGGNAGMKVFPVRTAIQDEPLSPNNSQRTSIKLEVRRYEYRGTRERVYYALVFVSYARTFQPSASGALRGIYWGSRARIARRIGSSEMVYPALALSLFRLRYSLLDYRGIGRGNTGLLASVTCSLWVFIPTKPR